MTELYFSFVVDDIVQAMEWDIVVNIYNEIFTDNIIGKSQEVYC